MYNDLTNNVVTIEGQVNSGFKHSYQFDGENFYSFELKVPRLSGSVDYLPVVVSERIVDVTADWMGQCVRISGQFRSFNDHNSTKTKLVLTIFVRDVECIEELSAETNNKIALDGYLCKEPIYRKTPLGREIADLLVAVNRPYGKSDYIPCICWGRNARYVNNLGVGSHVKIQGRIQSREYQKKISETEVEQRVAYEVSVSRITELTSGDDCNDE